jgi:predicted anti-sigma-YlaC factor YlaD
MSTRRCDRTRALLSQRLDGPLTEVDSRAVARHTAGCAACRAFEAQSRWLTDELRAAPLEVLARPLEISPVRVGRLSRRVVGSAVSLAATVVVAVGGWAVGTTANHEVPGNLAAPGGAAPGTVFGDGLRAIKVDALRAGELRILPPASPQRSVKPARPASDF